MKESFLYEKSGKNLIKCKTCGHFCAIAPGKRGICGVRENIDGKLFFLPYARVVAANVDPIEKKPLFHFLPGSRTFSIATAGCNLRCGNCQNWSISQLGKFSDADQEMVEKSGEELLPEKVVELAKENNCPSISYTYTEPTIFLEYALDTMKLARAAGLKNVWVSNGFMSKETLEMIIPYLDAINVDIKSFDEKFYRENCGARLAPILENCRTLAKNGVWLEITTLIIPALSDNEKELHKIANFIKNELGRQVPWHISAFSGAVSWKLQHLRETPIEKIRKAYEIGKKEGLKYVYAGNAPGINLENTFCSRCGDLLIKREGYRIERMDENGTCKKCKTKL